MSLKTKIILLCGVSGIILGMAGCAVIMEERKQQQAHQSSPLLPELAAELKQLRHLKAAKSNMQATIHLGTDAQWTVEEAHDYPANGQAIRTLLAQLSTARKKEAKTSDPARYAQLGLDEAGAVKLTLEDEQHAALLTVWIGKQNERGDGTYVRLEGDRQSWLVNEPMSPPLTLADWLAQPVLDIPARDIQSVEIRHRDGSRLAARRADAQAAFALENAEKVDPIKLGNLGNGLQQLGFEAVMPRSEFEPKDTALASTRYQLFGGGAVTVQPVLHHGHYWLLIDLQKPEQASKHGKQPLFMTAEDVSHWAYRVPDETGRLFALRLADVK